MYSDKDLKKYFPDGEERMAFSKVLDQALKASRFFEPCFTDFLDMERITLFTEKLHPIDGIEIYAFGGAEDCERRIMGFFPDFAENKESDFPIVPVIIEHSAKFSRKALSHRDYLGSLIGLGLDRRKLGDIFVTEESALVFAYKGIEDYITANLEYVGRTKVTARIYKGNADEFSPKEGVPKFITAASMRLDAVLSAAFNLSRGKAADVIKSELVKVNWKKISNTSFVLKEGDMVSLKGFGRVKISEIKGATKKNRVSIIIEKYV